MKDKHSVQELEVLAAIGELLVAKLDFENEKTNGFAQHTGRGKYVLHTIPAPINHNNEVINVIYKNGKSTIQLSATKHTEQQKSR